MRGFVLVVVKIHLCERKTATYVAYILRKRPVQQRNFLIPFQQQRAEIRFVISFLLPYLPLKNNLKIVRR